MEREKFYIVFSQTDCDDSYYRPYVTVVRIFKSKEKAIQEAKYLRKRTKKYSSPDDCYYVEEYTFDDDKKHVSCNQNIKNKESSDDDNNDEDCKKYYYTGEDEETYIDETDESYKNHKMVFIIGRKYKK